MQVLLRIANGKSNVRKVRIQSDTVIGRSPDCQLKVASNQISRRHCQIVIRDTVVAIKDLGSANGTFVNGRQVPPEVEIPLTPGTRVMLGPLQFTVEYDLPGLPGVAVAAPSTAIAPATVAAPQAQVETLQVVSDGQTPFPPLVVVPPQEAAQRPVPPAPQPAVIAAAAPAPAVIAPQVPAAHRAAPPLTEVAIPALIPAVAAPVIAAVLPAAAIPVAAAPPPAVVQAPSQPAAVVPPAPAAPQFLVPAVEAPEEVEEEDSGAFNFGIFAASGSGVVVESAPEIAMISEPDLSAAPISETAKPEKKGLLQMFGWGKKKPAAAAPEAVPETAPQPAENVTYEEVVMEAPAAVNGLSFELPVEEDSAGPDDDSSDESLQNFFNNFK